MHGTFFLADAIKCCLYNRASYDRSNLTADRPSRSTLHSSSRSTREGVSTPTTPAVFTRRFGTNQMKCDVSTFRYFVPQRHHCVAPHQLLLAPGDTSLPFDFAYDFPARHILTRHLQVHKMATQADDRHGPHGVARGRRARVRAYAFVADTREAGTSFLFAVNGKQFNRTETPEAFAVEPCLCLCMTSRSSGSMERCRCQRAPPAAQAVNRNSLVVSWLPLRARLVCT